MEEGHHRVDGDGITPQAGRAYESAVRREALQLSDAELAALGYVKAGSLQHGGSQTLEFSGGLLPDSAQAGTYEDASRERVVTVFGHKFSAGLLFVKGLGLELGMDLNWRELRSPAFYRAVVAEFVGTLCAPCGGVGAHRCMLLRLRSRYFRRFFLFFVVTTVVYRTDFAGGAVKVPQQADAAQRDLVNLVGVNGAAAQLMIASIFGVMITILVYGLAPVSGGHINPAISFGLMLVRKITVCRAVFYIAAQCGGAILGTLIAASLSRDTYNAAGGAVNGSTLYGHREIVVAEIFATALLVFVVYAAIDPARAGKVIHIGALGPVAIGGAVFAAHLALLPIDGTALNPARALGPAVVHGQWHQHWCFWVGPVVGASAAAVFYELCLKGREDGNGNGNGKKAS